MRVRSLRRVDWTRRPGACLSGPVYSTPTTFKWGGTQGLRELGYTEDTDIGIEARWADGNLDRVPGLAAELAASGVDVLVVTGDDPIRVARQMTSVIPIVMVVSADPVGL